MDTPEKATVAEFERLRGGQYVGVCYKQTPTNHCCRKRQHLYRRNGHNPRTRKHLRQLEHRTPGPNPLLLRTGSYLFAPAGEPAAQPEQVRYLAGTRTAFSTAQLTPGQLLYIAKGELRGSKTMDKREDFAHIDGEPVQIQTTNGSRGTWDVVPHSKIPHGEQVPSRRARASNGRTPLGTASATLVCPQDQLVRTSCMLRTQLKNGFADRGAFRCVQEFIQGFFLRKSRGRRFSVTGRRFDFPVVSPTEQPCSRTPQHMSCTLRSFRGFRGSGCTGNDPCSWRRHDLPVARPEMKGSPSVRYMRL